MKAGEKRGVKLISPLTFPNPHPPTMLGLKCPIIDIRQGSEYASNS